MHSLHGSARRALARPVSLLLALGSIVAACDTSPAGRGVFGPQASLLSTFHRVAVNVTDATAVPVPGIVVTATDVNTGEYFLALTSAAGQAILELPDGSYVVHARNLQSAGPAVPRPLSIAPFPDNAGLLPTSATQNANRLAVLWDPNAPGGSVPLDPANYSRLTLSPPLILSGPPSNPTINLQFLAGATLNCSFYQSNGEPLRLPSTENVFVVLPHGSGPLPPVPADLSGFNFPRAILLGVTTVPSGQSACALAGFSQGGIGAVIETNAVMIGSAANVFVGLVPPASGPTNAMIPLIAQPQLATTNYLLDDFGDAGGVEDIGLITSGWSLIAGVTSNNFLVTTRFRGLGVYTVDLRWVDPRTGLKTRLRVAVTCALNGCKLTSVSPSNLTELVSTTGTIVSAQLAEGAITWTIRLPGVTVVEFNVYGGIPPLSDVAPNTGAAVAKKDDGGGNSWIIPGD